MQHKKCGIYALYLKETDTYYIGYTMKSFIRRFLWHTSHLEEGKGIPSMQNDYEKYGFYNLELIILEEINKDYDKNYFKNREVYWTKKFLENGNKLYNQKIGDKFIDYNYNHTEEHKKNISEAYKGKGNPMYGKKGNKSPMYAKKHSPKTKETIRLKSSKFTIEEYKLIYEDLIEETNEKQYEKYKRLKEKWKCGEDLLKRIKSGRHWACEYFTN